MKYPIPQDVAVIGNSELCRVLGLPIQSFAIERISGVRPYLRTSQAVYWRTDDISAIAQGLSDHFSNLVVPSPALSITNLKLSPRVYRVLKAEGINEVGDLLKRSRMELLMTPNLGGAAVSEICEQLAHRGIALKNEATSLKADSLGRG
jgi:hypothetical protein